MTIPTIEVSHLVIGLIPVIPVLVIMFVWGFSTKSSLYAMSRMFIQLLLIGYLLVYIFDLGQPLPVLAVLFVMMCAASIISLNTVTERNGALYGCAFASIGVAGLLNLLVIVFGVLELERWYEPRFILPLAGMVFSNAMTSVSLAAERLHAELLAGQEYEHARSAAFHTALIPITNSMLAVGLVALPGMMTGQILGGVSPLIASRYQIMVMLMLFSTSGLAAACFVTLVSRQEPFRQLAVLNSSGGQEKSD